MRAIERFTPEVLTQPWGTESLIAAVPGATMKVLRYSAGLGGGLQYHVVKHEAFFVLEGEAIVTYDRGDGVLVDVLVKGGDPACVIPNGAPHQFIAVTDCLVVEVSTPGSNDRVNVAARYGRQPMPYDLPTTYTPDEIAAFEAGL